MALSADAHQIVLVVAQFWVRHQGFDMVYLVSIPCKATVGVVAERILAHRRGCYLQSSGFLPPRRGSEERRFSQRWILATGDVVYLVLVGCVAGMCRAIPRLSQ